VFALIVNPTSPHKFRGCADFARWPRSKAEAAIEFVKMLESAKDVGSLTAMLTG